MLVVKDLRKIKGRVLFIDKASWVLSSKQQEQKMCVLLQDKSHGCRPVHPSNSLVTTLTIMKPGLQKAPDSTHACTHSTRKITVKGSRLSLSPCQCQMNLNNLPASLNDSNLKHFYGKLLRQKKKKITN